MRLLYPEVVMFFSSVGMENRVIPAVTTDQMREIDRLMVEVYRIELLQMMENAGRNLAALSREVFLDGDPAGKRVLVLAG